MFSKPSIRSGVFKNIGATANGPFKLPIRFSTLICSRYFAKVAPNGSFRVLVSVFKMNTPSSFFHSARALASCFHASV